jgi:hypothetical protein
MNYTRGITLKNESLGGEHCPNRVLQGSEEDLRQAVPC